VKNWLKKMDKFSKSEKKNLNIKKKSADCQMFFWFALYNLMIGSLKETTTTGQNVTKCHKIA